MIKEVKDPGFWENIQKNPDYTDFINIVKETYEMNKDTAFSSLKYTTRRIYYQTGDRGTFETIYFSKRHFLSSVAILALIYPENEEYLNQLQDSIWNICEETSWVLPAHIKNDYEDYSWRIDLFSAQTGFALVEIVSLLGERMDCIVKDRAIDCVRKEIIEKFVSHKGFRWETVKNNWAAVCMGSVAGVMLYLAPEVFEAEKQRIFTILDHFLAGFPTDGTCLEGHGYWLYGFGHYCVIADLIYRYTDGRIDLMRKEKVKNIACYMQRNFLKGNSTISFSDGTRNGVTHTYIQYFLNKTFPGDVRVIPKELTRFCGSSIHFYAYLRGFLYYDPRVETAPPDSEDIYLPDAEQYIANRENYSFAIKGGRNNEPHNHNDIGSFILSDKTGQVFCDLGAGRYTREYFKAEHRYNYFCTSSLGHSVPIVGGSPQKAGSEYTGALTVLSGNSVAVQLAGAYAVPELKNLLRTVKFEDNRITLTDRIDAGGLDVTERFVTLIKPETGDGFVKVGGVILHYDPAAADLTVITELFEPHTYTGEFVPVYCIDLALKNGVTEPRFVFEI